MEVIIMEENNMLNSLSRKELINLVQKIMNCEGTEQEIDKWLEIAQDSVPHPNLSDLIFYPDRERTPEEIIEIALAYKPSLFLITSESEK
jgi:hypothetical protein